MTKKNVTPSLKPNHVLTVAHAENETGAQALARQLLEPHLRHGATASAFAQPMLGTKHELPGAMDYRDHMQAATAMAQSGDLTQISALLMAQALTLDSIFTEFARRSAINMGQYLDASERYARLALKAQNNSRATLEALANLHRPRETTVRHVHVNDGGQAIVADTVNYQPRATADVEKPIQSHATGAVGGGTKVPCPDPERDAMPITSSP